MNEIKDISPKEHDADKVKSIIKKLCAVKPMKSAEVAELLGKREDYIKRKFLGPMIGSKELKYLHPEMVNHPEQAYLTRKKE